MNYFEPSKRESEIIKLLLEGKSPKDIGLELGMAYKTVKVHLNRMYMRAGIVDGVKRVKLATMMYRRGK